MQVGSPLTPDPTEEMPSETGPSEASPLPLPPAGKLTPGVKQGLDSEEDEVLPPPPLPPLPLAGLACALLPAGTPGSSWPRPGRVRLSVGPYSGTHCRTSSRTRLRLPGSALSAPDPGPSPEQAPETT